MPRVLVIDDTAAIRECLADALRDEGYVVDAAASGPEALAFARLNAPALVLLDLMMPGMDGVAVAKALAAQGTVAPIFVLSADRSGAQRAQSICAKRYLAKPFDLTDLLHHIAEELRR